MAQQDELFMEQGRHWSAAHPETAECIGRIAERRGVAIFSSLPSAWALRAMGSDVPREPDDVDLLVRGDDFLPVVRELGAEIQADKDITVRSLGGLTLSMRADEAVAEIGDDVVQFMRPHTPLTSDDGHRYTTQFTDTADLLWVPGVDGNKLPVALGMTTLLYAILQRSGGKNDAANAAAAAQICPPNAKLMHEMGMLSDPRTIRWLSLAGIQSPRFFGLAA